MKKALLGIMLLALSSLMVNAQEESSKYGKIGENLKFGFEFISDYWLDTPEDLDLTFINRGFNTNLTYNRQLGKSPVSLGFGAGISSSNLYCKNSVLEADSETGVWSFNKIGEDENLDLSKVNLTYLDIPLELRYRFDFGLHINAGFKFGYLISTTNKIDDGTTKVKYKDLANFEEWRYGPTFRLGYKWINLTAYYQLNDVFVKDMGPAMTPLTFGIAIIPY
jgi:hypothetical protein